MEYNMAYSHSCLFLIWYLASSYTFLITKDYFYKTFSILTIIILRYITLTYTY